MDGACVYYYDYYYDYAYDDDDYLLFIIIIVVVIITCLEMRNCLRKNEGHWAKTLQE